MRLPLAHLFEGRTSESAAAWENEGGAIVAGLNALELKPAAPRWAPTYPVIESHSRESLAPGADQGLVDKHTLGIMQVSLLLVIPALAALAIFWGSVAHGVPGEAG